MREQLERLIGVVAGLGVLATLLAAGSCPCSQPADHTITVSQAQSGPGCLVDPEESEIKGGSTVKFVNKYSSPITLRFEAGVFAQKDELTLVKDQCAVLTASPVTQELDTAFVAEGCPNQPGPRLIIKP